MKTGYKWRFGAAHGFAALIVILTLLSLFISFRSKLARDIRDHKPVFSLLIGTDWVDNAQHSDTIILARYDPSSRSLDLLSIPRDTRVDIPKLKVKKINEVYAYAFRSSKKNRDFAAHELAKAVQWLLFCSSGVPEDLYNSTEPATKISYYVQVDYTGFKKMIDLLGGVPVTVYEPMHYDDNWGNLHIHFDPGEYVLTGQKALEYVRFRGLSGDSGRVSRQQQFVLKILNRFKVPLNLFKIPKIAWVSIQSVKTNLGWFERLTALWELKDLSKEHIRLIQLPGKPSPKGYWIVDSEGVMATAALLANGYKSVSETSPESEQPMTPIRSKTTVEVWNASGKAGLALDVVRKLRNAGFDVVKWGNYSSRQQRTLVRDHTGEKDQAESIAGLLSSSRVEIFTRVEQNPLVDVEVILGEEYAAEK